MVLQLLRTVACSESQRPHGKRTLAHVGASKSDWRREVATSTVAAPDGRVQLTRGEGNVRSSIPISPDATKPNCMSSLRY